MRRVVITGIGLVTPIGSGKEVFWKNLIEGRHGISDVTLFDTSAYRVHRGGQIHNFQLGDFLPDVDPGLFARATQFALAATQLALDDAGLDAETLPQQATGVSMGTTSGEPNLIESFNDRYVEDALGQVPTHFNERYPCHNIPAYVASHYGLTGTTPTMIPTACAAGNYAIAHGFDQIATGLADVMVVGGADAFSRITYTGFARLMAISPDLCRPFDRARKGMIPGEGSGVLILESLEGARRRRATILAEVMGCGLSCDAFHMTGSHPEGRGAVRAMQKALAESRINPEDVDYISAHGTGTKSNDLNETLSVKKVFGDDAYRVPISSIKSILGHTMGAASVIEAAACALAISRSVIPPTINLEEADPACDLDYVPNQARDVNVRIAMNNAYAFGGNNASVILKRLEDVH